MANPSIYHDISCAINGLTRSLSYLHIKLPTQYSLFGCRLCCIYFFLRNICIIHMIVRISNYDIVSISMEYFFAICEHESYEKILQGRLREWTQGNRGNADTGM